MKYQFRRRFLIALFVGMTTSSQLRADAYDFWVKRESGTTRHLFASAADTNVIVAVGEAGTLLTSNDGLTWRSQSLTSNTFYGVNLLVYHHPDGSWDPVSQRWKQKTNFLAVGQSGQFASSDDGAQWQVGNFGVDHPFYGIASSGYRLAAVGPRRILLSANGLTWWPEFSSQLLYGVGIVPAQSLAVVGANGLIWAKAGDQSWGDTLSPTVKTLTSIVSDSNFVVAVGDDGALLRGVYSSSSGEIQWTVGPVFPEIHFKHVAFASGYYFAVGSDRSTAEDFKFGQGVPSKGVLMTSPDGLRWTKRDVGDTPGLYSVHPFKGSLFAFGENGVILQNSSNSPGPAQPLDAWTPRLGNTTNALSSVAFGNGRFVAVGASGTILTSPDGAAWDRQNAPITGDIPLVRFLNGNFVALGNPFLISPDGINWRQAVTETTGGPFGGNYSDVTHGPRGFVAVGVAQGSPSTFFPLIATSTDGDTWRSGSGPNRIEFWGGVAHGNGIYLAVGIWILTGTSSVITSTDLETWAGEPLDFRARPRFGPGYFVLLGMFGDNRIGITMDGKNFEKQYVTFSNSSDATFGADTWVAVGPGGFIFSSPDARAWDPHPSGTTLNLTGVAYGAETFVAVGDDGMILQSGKLPPQIKPLLRQPRRNGQDQFLFTLGGEPGRVYVVQSSEDLIHWMDFMTGVSGEALPISPSKTAQFYRALPRNE